MGAATTSTAGLLTRVLGGTMPSSVTSSRLSHQTIRAMLKSNKSPHVSSPQGLGNGLPNQGRSFGVTARAMSPRVYAAAPVSEKAALQPEKTISVSLAPGEISSWEGDLLALGVFEGSIEKDDSGALKDASLKELDDALGGVVSEILEDEDFKAAQGSSSFVRIGGKARYFGLVGLGASDKASTVVDWGASTWQSAGAAIAAAAKANKAKTAGFAVLGRSEIEESAANKVALGVQLGAYESTRFKAKAKPSVLESLQIVTSCSGSAEEAAAIARGVTLTRYLVEAPPNVATPTHLAEAAAMIASEFSEVMSLKVLEKEDCEKLGMGCFLGVAEASAEPPKFIHLTYKPKGGDAKRKIAIVGKGLTFDSGGYNLKAGAGSLIEMMKFDMGGSGATLGAALATAGLAPEAVEVHFIVASCENMIDSKGLRPGDILTASNGTTVEVNNTDAEGRLTLADALLYAQEQCGVEAVVDIATLTGACMVALGPGIAGVMTPNEDMVSRVTAASKAAGEKVWRLPLESEYMDQLKSPIADMVNTGGRMGGTITAGLFLKEFIKEGVEWAHIDMAGPVWDDKKGGATGWGAATLAAWVQEESKVAASK